MLVDGHARRVQYLRLSLTERCNLDCVYCVPHEHEAEAADWLSDDEIVALVAGLVPLGLRRLRLTGGEPTLRPRLPELVARLAALPLDDLSMTTNGTRLTTLAAPLRAAGLRRLNISLDTLSPERFARLSGRRASLDEVLAGIDAANAAGFLNTKLNTVAILGLNDEELPAIASYAWARGLLPRFIERMPMSGGATARIGALLPAAAIRARLAAAFGEPVPDDAAPVPGVGPARSFCLPSGQRFGVIAAITERFCDRCNRVRISARGRLHTCLGLDDPSPRRGDSLDLRAALGRGPEALGELLQRALADKAEGHQFTTAPPRRHMLVIGG